MYPSVTVSSSFSKTYRRSGRARIFCRVFERLDLFEWPVSAEGADISGRAGHIESKADYSPALDESA
jgi:hypothetical protein